MVITILMEQAIFSSHTDSTDLEAKLSIGTAAESPNVKDVIKIVYDLLKDKLNIAKVRI